MAAPSASPHPHPNPDILPTLAAARTRPMECMHGALSRALSPNPKPIMAPSPQTRVTPSSSRACHQARTRAGIEPYLSCSRATTSHLSWGACMQWVRPWVRVAGRTVCGLGAMARRRWSGSRGLRTLPSMEHGSPKQTAEELTWRGHRTSIQWRPQPPLSPPRAWSCRSPP